MKISRRLATTIVDRRRWVVAFWIVLAALLVPLASKVEDRLEVAATIQGSESARVEQLLAQRFTSGFAQFAVLVMTGAPNPRTAGGAKFLTGIRDELKAKPFVSGTFSYLDAPDTLFVGRNGTTFIVVGLKPGAERPDKLIPLLRGVTEARARNSPDKITYRWTGEIALNHDLRLASAADAQNAEKRVMPITLILLVVAFGAVAASFLPLVAGGFAISLALGAAVVISGHWPLSILLENVVTMLGLGLGIDYALLVVGRFREGLAAGMSPRDAAIDAADNAGHTIILSGASVCIGFAALVGIPVNELKSLAVGGLLVIVMAVALATTLLPALLAMLGRRVNWLSIRNRQSNGSDRWRSWGRFVTTHPGLVLLVAGAPVVALALQARRLNTDLPRGDWLPPRMESAVGLRTLRDSNRSGIVNAIRIVVDLPKGSPWDSPPGWSALKKASDEFAADPRIARVRSLPAATGLVAPNLQVLSMMPASIRGSLASSDGRSALIELMPTEDASQGGAMDLVREIRSKSAVTITGLPGATLNVGGLPAMNVDYADATTGRFWSVVLAVVIVTMFALLVGFRSVLIALKAVALNLVSVAAAFGAVVLVFQDGIGIRLVGLSAPLDGTFSAIPLMVFCVVFGLSMDYEVFLVARVAEARRNGADDSEAIAEGLARTGGLITSAAAIMIVVFAGFTLGDFVIVKILGFALAVAVLVDATVVRIAIGPALFKLAGRWNWWPGERLSGLVDRVVAYEIG